MTEGSAEESQVKRSQIVPSIGAVCAALLAMGSLASSAAAFHGDRAIPGAVGTRQTASQHVAPAKKHGNCYSNMKNPTGIGILSQNFTDSGLDIYDSAGAVYFRVAKPCFASEVDVPGIYFNGSGPADSETVTFYADDGGMPGSVINSQTVVGNDSDGTFTIPLNPVRIPAGPAWVSVVATMSFASGGEWGWELSSNDKGHGDSMWENPGNGLSTGCTTWQDVATCLGYGNSLMIRVVKQYQQ